MKGIDLLPPGNWTDRSMIAFNAPDKTATGVAPNIVVTQDSFEENQIGTLDERIGKFAARQVKEMRGRLPSSVVHVHRPTAVAGRPAAEVYVSWLSGSVSLTQWVIFVARNETAVVIATATAAETEFADFHPHFANIVQSMKIDE